MPTQKCRRFMCYFPSVNLTSSSFLRHFQHLSPLRPIKSNQLTKRSHKLIKAWKIIIQSVILMPSRSRTLQTFRSRNIFFLLADVQLPPFSSHWRIRAACRIRLETLSIRQAISKLSQEGNNGDNDEQQEQHGYPPKYLSCRPRILFPKIIY
jgi:hypothetical protein